jgi:two-component system response regulator HydG
VALLDYKMPGMSGLELYRRIKEVRAGTVAVLVSAYTDPATQDAALRAGVWKVLPKPVDPSRLLGLVNEAVGQPLVLVVDDDPDLCANLWDILRDRGFRVCLAGDARTATDRLKDRYYKVVLVDLRLPDADGTAVVHAVHEVAPGARAVVITGQPASAPLVQETLRGGVDALCFKPLDVPRLLEALNRLVR